MTEAAAFPIGLRLRGRRAVVAGGGPPALPPVTALLAAGADVLVVAPELAPALAELAASGLISVRKRGYQPADLDGAWLAHACAGNTRADAAVAADAERLRIWCASPGRGSGGAGTAEIQDTAEAPDAEPESAGTPGTDQRLGRRALVLGGARSGKSATAEAMLSGQQQVEYVATGLPPGQGDQEWDARVAAHRLRRPAGWRTTETVDLAAVLAAPASAGPALVDCVSTWLARVMDDCGCWQDRPGAGQALAERADGLVTAWQGSRRQVVAVSNEVGSGVVPAAASGRLFRDELGQLNTRLAAASDEVWLCTAGIARRLR